MSMSASSLWQSLPAAGMTSRLLSLPSEVGMYMTPAGTEALAFQGQERSSWRLDSVPKRQFENYLKQNSQGMSLQPCGSVSPPQTP